MRWEWQWCFSRHNMLVPGLQAPKVCYVVHILTMYLMSTKFEQASLTSKMTAAKVMVDAFHKFRVVCAGLRVGGIWEHKSSSGCSLVGGRRPQLEGQQLLAGQHSGLAFSDVPISVQILRICQTCAFPVLSKFPWCSRGNQVASTSRLYSRLIIPVTSALPIPFSVSRASTASIRHREW
jgi:hypothetical protein